MPGVFDEIRQGLDIMVNPQNHAESQRKILEAFDLTCPFKVGDFVVRKDPNTPFTYPRPGMPAKVVRVFSDFEAASLDKDYYDMACSIVTDSGKVTVYAFRSIDFIKYVAPRN